MHKSLEINTAKQENPGGLLEASVTKGIEETLAAIKKNFEDAPEKKDNLDFHNTRHTEGVVRRTEKILSVLKEAGLLYARDVEIGKLAGAFHDIVQKYEENPIADGKFVKILRKRFTKANETKSAELGVAYMEKANQESGQMIFSSADMETLREAIDATVPDFNKEKGTVIQPNLNEKSSLVTRAVALADLGAAGMDGPEKFLPEGDALFREENLDIADALKNIGEITDGQKEYFRKRMLGWSGFQAVFANGIKELLDSELAAIPEEAREKIKLLFNKFDGTIEASRKKAMERETMTFEELARDMGYPI